MCSYSHVQVVDHTVMCFSLRKSLSFGDGDWVKMKWMNEWMCILIHTDMYVFQNSSNPLDCGVLFYVCRGITLICNGYNEIYSGNSLSVYICLATLRQLTALIDNSEVSFFNKGWRSCCSTDVKSWDSYIRHLPVLQYPQRQSTGCNSVMPITKGLRVCVHHSCTSYIVSDINHYFEW